MPAQIRSLQKVTYTCELLQYPPVLEANIAGHKLRLLIEFGDYYTNEDQNAIVSEAQKESYSVLLYQFPDIKATNFFTSKNLTDCVIRGKAQSFWLRSALEEKWRAQFLNHAHTPKRNSIGYDCPIHIAKYGEICAVRNTDCAQCWFNLGEWPQSLCIGTDIQSLKDLGLSPEKLQQQIEEMKRQRILTEGIKAAQEKAMIQSAEISPLSVSPAKCVGPSGTELDAERDWIVSSFNPESREQIRDRFGRRWIRCEKCGKIKLDQDMAEYGGRLPNRGICRACARKR